MKYLIFFLIVFSTNAENIVPLDIKAGLWESSVKNFGKDLVTSLLSQMPEGPEKEKIKKQVDAKIKKMESKKSTFCLTPQEINNPKKAMSKFTKNKNTQNCKLILKKSTAKNLDYDVVCNHNGMTVNSTFKFVARSTTLMIGDGHVQPVAPGMPDQKFKVTSKWISETCKKK